MNNPGKLLRYSASAGSGKTHALSGFYLSRVLHDPGSYRRILAVTFTNSAAAEMKERILSRLNRLSSDDKGGEEARAEFAAYLCHHFPDLYPDPREACLTVRKNAPLALRNILQDYSRFTVSTIDSFFQRVIRAFAREIDIPSGYEIEIEHDALLSDAVDGLLGEVAADERLRHWITSYVASRLDDNKGWDVRREIMEVAQQIFGENFRQLSPQDRKAISDHDTLREYTSKVFSVKNGFESELRTLAIRGKEIFESSGMAVDDFLSRKRGGVGEILRRYSLGETKPPTSTWNKAASEGRYTAAGAPPGVTEALNEALKRGLDETVKGISALFENRYSVYLSAVALVRTIHVMGILGAISEKVRVLAHDENLFLLSDSGELINKLIADDDTPFIYEKIGTAYDHYIIDEFQDTSRIQWKNFRPLISETISRGKDNLVVGDVKQSIFRWRNSDWRILHSEINRVFDSEAVKTIHLGTNHRSRENIIAFNNMIFSPEGLPALCDATLACEQIRISDIYRDSVQEGLDDKPGGLVNVTLYNKDDEESWKERVLKDIPAVIEQLQDHGYRANEILFLCRKNDEGKSIINRILEYSAASGSERQGKYSFEVTSGESLFLERNPAVNLLLSCLRYLVDPESRINMSLMVRSCVLATGGKAQSAYAGDTAEGSADVISGIWKAAMDEVRNDSLFSATEKLIRHFDLGSYRENVAYISSFQDVILWYSGRYSSDISSFVSWWEREGHKKTLAQSDRQEAMRVMTIHKAKGLQSKVVIIPFASWGFSKQGFNRPLLWVTEVPEEFAPMPVVLPELSSRLEESLFAEQAKREKASEWLDGINMLYVAFTRAVDALYIMAPDMSHSQGGGADAESLLNEALKRLPDDYVWTDNGTGRNLIMGELPPVSALEEKPSIIMSSYQVSEQRGTMRLRTGGALPLDEMKLTEPGNRAYGIMMHELLSRIMTANDIDKAVTYVCNNGLLPLSKRDLIASRVRTILNREGVKSWFDGSADVRTEATIILPSGEARRPDRVMIQGDNVIVVDYKFGEPTVRHKRQASDYRDLLLQMGYARVSSWLWYVEKDIIEEA
ncbi:MAG: UvrD-helicase domain-containing protein [Bacteroidales bacterium]|nr:UvrD-helicase domain-containing protein [Bacteroidales bacterium]